MYICKFCKRETNNAGGLGAHEKHCKENPDRIHKILPKSARAQKGSVPWNKGKKVGRSDYWEKKFPLKDVMVENSTYARHNLKKRLIAENVIKYECQICGLGPMWQGKEMVLILDHINGVNNDNRKENLRFVCSNCDSQLPTYKARNKAK